MLITLQQDEIETAITEYVANSGIEVPVRGIDFTAGRGEKGLTVEITVGAESQSTSPNVRIHRASEESAESTDEPSGNEVPVSADETADGASLFN